MANKKDNPAANTAAPEVSVEELMKQLAEERAAKEAAEKKAAEAEKAKSDAEAALAEKEAEKETGIFYKHASASPVTDDREKEKAYYNELVTIELFKDNERYKDDVFVGHNGRTYQIQRGVPVQVPRKVALILEQSKIQNFKAAELKQQKASEFAEKEKNLK